MNDPNRKSRRVRRGIASLAATGVVLLLPVGVASADGGDEKYPPSVTEPPKRPAPAPTIPSTGNSGTDVWLKVGAGALMVGGVLVVAGSRRRTVSTL